MPPQTLPHACGALRGATHLIGWAAVSISASHGTKIAPHSCVGPWLGSAPSKSEDTQRMAVELVNSKLVYVAASWANWSTGLLSIFKFLNERLAISHKT